MVEKNVPWFSDKDFNKWTVGYDKLVSDLMHTLEPKISNYPPYNIRRMNDTEYVIEIAVAGFRKSDINIELDENLLKITGDIISTDSGEYLHKGIAERSFTRNFTLAEYVEVKSAEIINGLLKINLERVIPESKKPRKIDINSEVVESKLLNESKKK